MIVFVIALVTSIAGVAALYVSWWRRVEPRWLIVMAGWMAICLSAALWMRAAGAEFGTAYAAIAIAFTAWAIAAALGRGTSHPAQPRLQRRVNSERPKWRGVLGAVARALVAIPLAGTASVLASVLAVAPLPWAAPNRYVLAIVVAPIVWGLTATWASTTAVLGRAALLLAGTSAACAAVLFVRW